MDALNILGKPFTAAANTDLFIKVKRFLLNLRAALLNVVPDSPQRKLMFQVVTIATVALAASSLTPGGSFVATNMTYSNEYINAYSVPGDVLVSDESGYLVKVNPQTEDSNRVGLTDYAVHTVESGESLSVIAARYGVNVNTIIWENKLSNANSIRVGQKLLVPPVDGISYTVASGDSLEKIASKYEISVDAIIAQNGLASEVVTSGQSVFLPGAVPAAPPVNIAVDYRVTDASRDDRAVVYTNASASTSTPTGGKVFIFPTMGKITQGYHGGHYALDIADSSMPPIWAAGGGTVSKVSTGTWGGGYGNHVIIDHGNGLQTLYAHMDSVSVYSGQWVNQGDVLGVMGNTGRVYGITGIHLHWEVIQDGVKQYPGNYY